MLDSVEIVESKIVPENQVLVIPEDRTQSFFYDLPVTRLDWCNLANEIIDRDIFLPSVILAMNPYDFAIAQLEQLNPIIH